MSAPPLPPADQERIRQDYAATGCITTTARRLGYTRNTVRKYTLEAAPVVMPAAPRVTAEPVLPDPAPEAGGPALPDPVPLSYDPFVIDTAGHWGVLGDVHLPYHDKATVEAFVAECRHRAVTGVLLNGDILDCGECSDHYRNPGEPRLEEELTTGERFFAWLRSRLPGARIVYKEGNHEFRIPRYLANNAPALCNSKHVQLPKLLDLDRYGVEWVADKRVVQLGKLPVVHGHEFRGGGGVNPARWLFLRSVSTAMCNHFHRSSEHFETGLDRRVHGVWSVGCACYLYPQYDPQNKWNWGYALVEVGQGGAFEVTNRKRLRDGRVV